MGELNGLRQRDAKPDTGNGAGEVIQMNGLNGDVKSRENAHENGRFARVQSGCRTCCIPCLTSENPLPENADICTRLKHGLMLPLHGSLASYIQFVMVCAQIWIVLYSLTHSQALPGGNFFSLLILFVCCVVGGYLTMFIRLPPLLGMLIMGVLLRNLTGVKIVGENIDTKWSGVLRKVALTVILTRAGLGLDIVKLRKLSWAVLRLAFLPCLSEIITVGIVSRYLLGFPWLWSLLLGCILGALSPAVTVPLLVNLQDRRYGVQKGIPTMLLAAGGLDNVLCVTGFSVFLGIIFSEGDLAVTIVKGPVGVLVGIVYGFAMGAFLWYIPAKDCVNKIFFRSILLFGSGLIATFGSSEIGLAGAGPIGCLTTATVAAYKWRQRRKPGETDELAGVMALAWLIVQHFLFGLIGAAVNISNIKSNTAGLGIATLGIGLGVRSVLSSTVTHGTGFNFRERVFVTMTWISKATVQAAIGGLALDRALEEDTPDEEQVRLGTDVLTLSVLAIIVCAPIGATLMAILGPKFLAKAEDDDVETVVISGTKRVSNPDLQADHILPASRSAEVADFSITTERTLQAQTPDHIEVQGITGPHTNITADLLQDDTTNDIQLGIVNLAFKEQDEEVTIEQSEDESKNNGGEKTDIANAENTSAVQDGLTGIEQERVPDTAQGGLTGNAQERVPDTAQDGFTGNEQERVPATAQGGLTGNEQERVPATAQGGLTGDAQERVPATAQGGLTGNEQERVPDTAQGGFTGNEQERVPDTAQDGFTGNEQERVPATAQGGLTGNEQERVPATAQGGFTGNEQERVPATAQGGFTGNAQERVPATAQGGLIGNAQERVPGTAHEEMTVLNSHDLHAIDLDVAGSNQIETPETNANSTQEDTRGIYRTIVDITLNKNVSS